MAALVKSRTLKTQTLNKFCDIKLHELNYPYSFLGNNIKVVFISSCLLLVFYFPLQLKILRFSCVLQISARSVLGIPTRTVSCTHSVSRKRIKHGYVQALICHCVCSFPLLNFYSVSYKFEAFQTDRTPI